MLKLRETVEVVVRQEHRPASMEEDELRGEGGEKRRGGREEQIEENEEDEEDEEGEEREEREE